MASLSEIQDLVQRIKDDLPLLVQRSQISPNQVVIQGGLSDLSERLGLIQAGEFRSGNGKEPGFGFSGIRIGYPAFVYAGELWNIVGVDDDTLQVGIRASDGKLVFGGGDGFADEFGLFFLNQEGFLGFQSATTGEFDDVGMYIDSLDDLILTNQVGGKGIRFDIDDASHNVIQYIWGPTSAAIPVPLELESDLVFTLGGATYFPITLGWYPLDHTWTRVDDHSFTVDGDLRTIYRKGARLAYTDNGASKYGTVDVPSYDGGADETTVQLFVNTDYTFAAGGTLASPLISYEGLPSSFPGYFNWDSAPTSITVGDGAVVSRFSVSTEGYVDYEWSFDLGTTGAVTGQINFTPPVPSDHPGSRPVVGVVAYLEAGVVNWAGVVLALNGVAGDPFALRAFDGSTSAYVRQVNISGTVPFTFGAGDGIYVTGRYRY